jgi:alpha-beta hydrolase superfamily lysophospholipase
MGADDELARLRAALGPVQRRTWRAAAIGFFRLMMPNRHWRLPRIAGVRELRTLSDDGVPLAGWCAAPDRPRGTVLIVHGLTRNCTLDGIPDWGRAFLDDGFAVGAIDLRGHGRSGDGVLSFGASEGRDVSAALAALAAQGYPPPYVCMGGSLGALAAQRAAVNDRHISGVALVAMPAWPWHGVRAGGRAIADLALAELSERMGAVPAAAAAVALRAAGRWARGVAALVNAAHGFDALAAGDIRRLPRPRRTAVLHVIGDRDPYDWRLTALAWRHWSREVKCRPHVRPGEAPEQGSWLMLARGYGHPPARPHVLEWPHLDGVLREFLEVVVEREASRRQPIEPIEGWRRNSA